MADLALAVGCSLVIGVILKYAAQQGLDRIVLLTANYAVAFVMAASFLGLEAGGPGLSADPWLIAQALGTGGLFIFAFFMYALATEVAGLSLAIGVMRVAVVVPFLASWWIWQETPTPAQGGGLVLAGLAFFLIAHTSSSPEKSAKTHRGRLFAVLAGLFLTSGLIDVSMKTFDEVFAAENSRSLFLLMIFGVAFLLGMGVTIWQWARQNHIPTGRTIMWGMVLGAVNYASTEFFLRAVEQLSGPFVFPVNHIAVVLGGALLGVYVWGEHLTRLNKLGLLMAAVALVLMSL